MAAPAELDGFIRLGRLAAARAPLPVLMALGTLVWPH